MIVYFNDTKKYNQKKNLNSFFNDTNNVFFFEYDTNNEETEKRRRGEEKLVNTSWREKRERVLDNSIKLIGVFFF